MQMFNTHSIIYSCSHSRPGNVTAFINREAKGSQKGKGLQKVHFTADVKMPAEVVAGVCMYVECVV